MRLSKVLWLLPALALSSLSQAEEKPFYLGLGYSFAELESDKALPSYFTSGQSFSEDTNSIDLYAGYQFSSYFSIELNYNTYDQARKRYDIDPTVDFITAPNDLEELEVDTLSLNSVLSYPIAENLKVLALAGFIYADIDNYWFGGEAPSISHSDSETGFTYGVGASYAFTERFSGKLQWKTIDIDNLELEGLHLSVETRF
ncbi:porin family protein [Microbulbifer sp. GL-2]|uniref:porin family protein n=1 Tax=Microbulbifer sp. GL-2 TaxID=2591606 RepID=UPI001161EB7A|nr:porin family protein [Microbulbifer sp. GL-2]BBM04086.1 hypothetical protein GL2_41600 [Microbulbifer sp. GL-2]